MEKRPTSMTVIGWLLIVASLFGIYSIATINSNPIAANMLQQMHITPALFQAWSAIGLIVNLCCAYGILKGQPWSRVLYLVWGILGLVVNVYISPIKATVVLGIVFLVVLCAFLWTNTANDWFQARGFMLKRERSR